MGKARRTVPAWRQQAAAAIERARFCNANQTFAVAGHINDMPFAAATSIHVAGLPGALPLPIGEQQLSSLLSIGEPAPFGLGTETVLDAAVRKATQIEAARVQTNDIWQQQMQHLTARVAKGLGVDEHVLVEAHPYKLLIYTAGGHFKAHRDTEKEPGMFGTLVVQLPVVGGHVGGQFLFRHNGKTISWATETNSSSQFQYAAFYADVEHELQPITSGTRVVLVYSLVRVGTNFMPKPRDTSPLVQKMRAAFASWEIALSDDDYTAPERLYVPLEHKYTEASLSFGTLKGNDARMVSCLTHPDVGLEVHVALMVKTKKYDDCNPRRDRPTEVKFEAQSCMSSAGVNVSETIIEQFIQPDGAWTTSLWLQPIKSLDVKADDDHRTTDVDDSHDHGKDNDEESDGDSQGPEHDDDDDNDDDNDIDDDEEASDSQDSDDGREEDELRDVNYTGNECSTVEKIYRQAVLIIWPRARTADMVGNGQLLPALYLLELRLAYGSATEQESALELVMSMYKESVTKFKNNNQNSTGSDSSSLYKWHMPIDETKCAEAFRVLGKLQPALAVPAILTILEDLPALGYNNLRQYKSEEDKYDEDWHWSYHHQEEPRLRDTLVGSLIDVGLPDALVSALVKKVKAIAIKGTVACAQLAVAAAKQSAVLGAALADAVLSQTVFATDPQQVLDTVPDSHVCALAVMLCEVPTQHKHLDAFASVAANLTVKEHKKTGPRYYFETEEEYGKNEPRSILKKILKSRKVKAAVFHSPNAVVTMAGAYRRQLEKKLQPVPRFAWEMPSAALRGYPEVEAFFHSSAMSATFSDCFQDGMDAQKLLREGFKQWVDPRRSTCDIEVHLPGQLSANVTASGLDGIPVVTITKTQEHHKLIVEDVKALNKDIKKLIMRVDDMLKLCKQVLDGVVDAAL